MFLNYIYSIKRILIGDYPTITMSTKPRKQVSNPWFCIDYLMIGKDIITEVIKGILEVKIANYHRFIYVLPFENHGNHGILC